MNIWLRLMGIMVALALLAPGVMGSISVEKEVGNGTGKVGESISISLKIKNTFREDVPIKIVDKTDMAGSGVDIQCLESAVPALSEIQLSYEDKVVLAKEGSYSIAGASVFYTDPKSGKEEQADSDRIEFTIEKNPRSQGVFSQMVSVFECNNMQSKSTSMSLSGQQQSSSQQSQQTGFGQKQTQSQQTGSGQQDPGQGQSGQQDQGVSKQQTDQIQDKLVAGQGQSDGVAMKQQIAQQVAEQQQQMNELHNQALATEEVQSAARKLLEEGFSQDGASMDPLREEDESGEAGENSDDDSGSGDGSNGDSSSGQAGQFSYTFNHPNGTKAEIRGVMRNNSIEDFGLDRYPPMQDMMQQLGESEEFVEHAQEFSEQGLAQQQPKIEGREQGVTTLAVPYNYSQGNVTMNATIVASFNGTQLVNVTRHEPEVHDEHEKEMRRYWLWLLTGLVVGGLLYLGYRMRRPSDVEAPINRSSMNKKKRDDVGHYFSLAQKALAKKETKKCMEYLSRAVRCKVLKDGGTGHITPNELKRLVKGGLDDVGKSHKKLLNEFIDACIEVEFAGGWMSAAHAKKYVDSIGKFLSVGSKKK